MPASSRRKPRNIIICSDGTGNAGGLLANTNVWRIRQAVADATEDKEREQVVIYQDGVGTEDFRPLAIVGLVFSHGITRRLESLYSRLIQQYREGDQIYLFGFSRGAFTIRTLAYILDRCGIADIHDKDGNLLSPKQIDELAAKAVDAYKFRHVGDDDRFRLSYGLQNERDREERDQDSLSRLNDIAGVKGEKSGSVSLSDITRRYEIDGIDAEAALNELTDELKTRQADRAKRKADRDTRTGRFPIQFIGVWDTVAAVGLPFRNTTQSLLKFWRKVSRRFSWARISLLNFHCPTHNEDEKDIWKTWDDDDLRPNVCNAFQALAIDDERQTFYPVLWLENDQKTGEPKKYVPPVKGEPAKKMNIQQVWFSGMHANVGGGYPKDHLAYVSLNWMIGHAKAAGLAFKSNVLKGYEGQKDEMGKMYDSRAGLAMYYRYKPRVIAELCDRVGIDRSTPDRLPKIHESVFKRISESTLNYAPGGLPTPGEYVQVTHTSESLESDSPSKADISANATKNVAVDAWSQAKQHAQGYVSLSRGSYYTFFVLTLLFIIVGILDFKVVSGIENWGYSKLRRVYVSVAELSDSISFGGGILNAIPILSVIAVPVVLMLLLYWLSDCLRAKYPEARILALGGICAIAFFMMRPTIRAVLLWFSPGFAAAVVDGVCSSAFLFTTLCTAVSVNVMVNQLFRQQLREWNVYGWRTSMGKDAKKPDEILTDWFAGHSLTRSWLAGIVDRYIAPALAISILLVLLWYPFRIAPRDLLVRLNLQQHENAETESGPQVKPTTAAAPKTWTIDFKTTDMLDTGIDIQEGHIYTVSVAEKKKWLDSTVAAGPDGVEEARETLAMRFGRPFRQIPDERYLKVCGVVGDLMNDPFPIGAKNTFVAHASGRLFLFANDVPGLHANNKGTAEIMVTQE